MLNPCCGGCCSLQSGTKAVGFLVIVVNTLALLRWLSPVYQIIASFQLGSTIAIDVFYTITIFTITIILLIGAFKSKSVLLVPWLTVTVIGTTVGVIYGISIAVNLSYVDTTSVGIVIGVLVTGFALFVYFWLVVLCYYKELESCKNPHFAIPLHQQDFNCASNNISPNYQASP